jgi:hypothetical protein
MRYPIEHTAENHVRAVFATSTSSFDLPCVATFEDLADRLASLSGRHDGPLIGIRLEADPSAAPRSLRSAMLCRLANAGEEIWRAGF